jgi:cytochrome b pre-mRNA-processing protein 3
MFNKKQNITKEEILYSKIILFSRNKIFYTKFNLKDTFQNRIHLIFIHISFLFIKIKQVNNQHIYNDFYQKTFDLIFKNIELNMREIGYGDTIINKNMKFLVKSFYAILLECENYRDKTDKLKNAFLCNYLSNNEKNNAKTSIIEYFNKYETFCFDLRLDSVLEGNFNFNYR